MKNILKSTLLLLFISSVVACSGLLNEKEFGNGTENVSFTFRAGENLTGGKINVSCSADPANPQSAEIVPGQAQYNFTFENVPAGKVVSFAAFVSMPNGDILYEGVTSQNIASGNNVVKIVMDPLSGYFLWDMDERKGKVSYSMKDNLDLDFSDGATLSGGVADFCFDNKMGLWILNKDKSVVNIKHGQKGTEGQTFNSSSGATSVYSICAYKDGFLIGGRNGDAQIDYVTFGSSVQAKMLAFNPSASSLFNEIYAIAVAGDKVFLGTNSTSQVNDFQIFQGTVDMDNPTGRKFNLNATPVFTSTNVNAFNRNGFKITDLQVVDNYLYALVIDAKEGANNRNMGNNQHNSRGAVIKISIDNPSSYVVKGLLSQSSTVPDGSGQAAYIMGESDSKLNSCFLGPRKFIAIKPKELVIADAGAVSTGSKLKTKKRVVSINTQTIDVGSFAFSDISNMGSETLFSGSISTSSNEYVYQL